MNFNSKDKVNLKNAEPDFIKLTYNTKEMRDKIFVPFLDFFFVYDNKVKKLRIKYYVNMIEKPYLFLEDFGVIIYINYKNLGENYILSPNEYFFSYEEACDSIKDKAESFVYSLDFELTKLFDKPRLTQC